MPETAHTASNALYNGQARGFEEACALAAQAARDEQAAMRRELARWGARATAHDAASTKALDDYASNAQRSAAIYREIVAGVTATIVARLRAEGLDEFADALELGDWSTLAI